VYEGEIKKLWQPGWWDKELVLSVIPRGVGGKVRGDTEVAPMKSRRVRTEAR